MNTTATPAAPMAIRAGAAIQPGHLSWSGLKCYADCPRKFHFRYVMQAPVEFVPASLAFGGAFHKATELLHQAGLEGIYTPTWQAVISKYKEAWEEEVAQAPVVHFNKDENACSLYGMAEWMIAAYWKHLDEHMAQSAGRLLVCRLWRITLCPFA